MPDPTGELLADLDDHESLLETVNVCFCIARVKSYVMWPSRIRGALRLFQVGTVDSRGLGLDRANQSRHYQPPGLGPQRRCRQRLPVRKGEAGRRRSAPGSRPARDAGTTEAWAGRPIPSTGTAGCTPGDIETLDADNFLTIVYLQKELITT